MYVNRDSDNSTVRHGPDDRGVQPPDSVPARKGRILARRRALGLGCLAAMGGGVAHAYTNTALTVVGATEAQVHAKVSANIYSNISHTSTASLLKFTDKEWQAVAWAYQKGGGTLTTLDAVVKTRLPTIYAHYHAVTHQAGPTMPTADPGITTTELFVVFRTSELGAADLELSLFETSLLGAYLLHESYQFGQVLGNELYWLIDTYDPALSGAMGQDLNFVVSALTNIGPNYTAAVDNASGWWSWQLNQHLFAIPMSKMGSFTSGLGDDGVADGIGPGDVAPATCTYYYTTNQVATTPPNVTYYGSSAAAVCATAAADTQVPLLKSSLEGTTTSCYYQLKSTGAAYGHPSGIFHYILPNCH